MPMIKHTVTHRNPIIMSHLHETIEVILVPLRSFLLFLFWLFLSAICPVRRDWLITIHFLLLHNNWLNWGTTYLDRPSRIEGFAARGKQNGHRSTEEEGVKMYDSSQSARNCGTDSTRRQSATGEWYRSKGPFRPPPQTTPGWIGHLN